jgi:hypothetical protein
MIRSSKLRKLLLLSFFAALVYIFVQFSIFFILWEPINQDDDYTIVAIHYDDNENDELGDNKHDDIEDDELGVEIGIEKEFDTDGNTNIDNDNINDNIDIINNDEGNDDDIIHIIEKSTYDSASASASALQSDILKMTHAPNKGLITIHFVTLHSSDNTNDNTNNHRTRQCFNPIVRGRLSGPSLAIIEWTDHISEYEYEYKYDQQNNATDTAASPSTRTHTRTMTEKITGRYQVPQTGKYYIEIIGIVCNHKFHIKEHNFKHDTCLITPSHHRLTAIGASIDVTVVAVSTSASNKLTLPSTTNHFNSSMNTQLERSRQGSSGSGSGSLGYWKRRSENSTPTLTGENLAHDYDYDPLYTRYQPLNCRDTNATLQQCTDKTDVKRYEPYVFEFNNDIQAFMDKSFQLHSFSSLAEDQLKQQKPFELSISSQKTVCVIGFSHTRYIINSVNQILTSTYNNTLNIGIEWIKARNPSDLHDIQFIYNQYANNNTKNCTHILVGLGQWPGYKPMLFDQYENDTEVAMEVLLKAREELGFKLFFRSIQ